MPQMSVPERASLWGIRKERKRRKGWTDYIAEPDEAVGTSLESRTPGPPPSRSPPPPPPIPVPPGMFDNPPPIPPLPKRPPKASSSVAPPSISISSSTVSDSSSNIGTNVPENDESDVDVSSSPLAQVASQPESKVLSDEDLFDQIEIEVQPDSPTHVHSPAPVTEMEVDWEALINERLSRGKTNPVLPGSAPPTANPSPPSSPAQFDDPPPKKVQRKKKGPDNFDMMDFLRSGPPFPQMPNWAEEHRKFLLDRQMRQKFEPPFRLFCVREDQGSQRQPWPMPWEDSDRDPSDSEQEELARQERKVARQAKRREKRKEIKKEERRRQREELLKQAKKLAQQEVDEARAERGDAESRDSDEDERKSFGKLMLSVDSDSNDDNNAGGEMSEDSLGTEDETTVSEDDDSVTDMAKQLSQNSPWMKKRLNESLPDSDGDEQPQSELEKRLVRGDKFRMYDGAESDDIKICVDLNNRCLRFEGSADDGVSLVTSSFQLKRGICDLDENNQLQPSTVLPQAGMDPKLCMTLATGRANEKGVLQATDVTQIDAWLDGIHGLRERFLDDAVKLAMKESDSEEDEPSDEEVEVSFHTPSSSPKITPKKKAKSLMRDINSSESEEEENEERIETVTKSTYAIPLEWTIVNSSVETALETKHEPVSPIARKLLQEEVGRDSSEEDDGIPEAIIHLPTSKPKRAKKTRASTPLMPNPEYEAQLAESNSSKLVVIHETGTKNDSNPAGGVVEATTFNENTLDKAAVTEEIKIAKFPEANPLEAKEEPVSRTSNVRAGRIRRAAVAVKPSVPIPRHIPEDEETDSGETKEESIRPVPEVEVVPEESLAMRCESEAERQMRELETAIEFDSFEEGAKAPETAKRDAFPEPPIKPESKGDVDQLHEQIESQSTEAERQMRALEADFGFDSTSSELKQVAVVAFAPTGPSASLDLQTEQANGAEVVINEIQRETQGDETGTEQESGREIDAVKQPDFPELSEWSEGKTPHGVHEEPTLENGGSNDVAASEPTTAEVFSAEGMPETKASGANLEVDSASIDGVDEVPTENAEPGVQSTVEVMADSVQRKMETSVAKSMANDEQIPLAEMHERSEASKAVTLTELHEELSVANVAVNADSFPATTGDGVNLGVQMAVDASGAEAPTRVEGKLSEAPSSPSSDQPEPVSATLEAKSEQQLEVILGAASSRAGRTRRAAVATRPTSGVVSGEMQHRGTDASVRTDSFLEAQSNFGISELEAITVEPTVIKPTQAETEAWRQMKELEAAIGLDKFEDEPRIAMRAPQTDTGEIEAVRQMRDLELSMGFDMVPTPCLNSTDTNITSEQVHSESIFFSERQHPSIIVTETKTPYQSGAACFAPEISLPLSAPDSADIEQYSVFWRDTGTQLELCQPTLADSSAIDVAVEIDSLALPQNEIPLEMRGVHIDQEQDGKTMAKRKDGLSEPLLLEGDVVQNSDAEAIRVPKRKKSICGDCVLL